MALRIEVLQKKILLFNDKQVAFNDSGNSTERGAVKCGVYHMEHGEGNWYVGLVRDFSDIKEEQNGFMGNIMDLICKKEFPGSAERLVKEIIANHAEVKWEIVTLLALGSQEVIQKKLSIDAKEVFARLIKCGAYIDSSVLNAVVDNESEEVLQGIIQFFKEEVVNYKIRGCGLLPCFPRISFGKFILLVEGGVDINSSHFACGTFLHHLLAEGAWSEAIERVAFLEGSANTAGSFDYAAKDSKGRTPLMIAVLKGCFEFVDVFINFAENINIGLEVSDEEGRTPLLIAAALGRTEIVAKLLQFGANINAKDKYGRDLDWYIDAPKEIIAEILQSIGIEPARDYRALQNWVYANVAQTEVFLFESADSEGKLLISHLDDHGVRLTRALQEALTLNDGGKTFHRIREQVLPLYDGRDAKSYLDACKEGQAEAQKIIKEHQLRLACAFGQEAEVINLIVSGVDCNAQDHLGRTAMHYAVMRSELVKKLLDSVSLPMTLAEAMEHHAEIVKILLRAKADLSVVNKNGKNSSDLIERDKKSDNELDRVIAEKIGAILDNEKHPEPQSDEKSSRKDKPAKRKVKILSSKYNDAIQKIRSSPLMFAWNRKHPSALCIDGKPIDLMTIKEYDLFDAVLAAPETDVITPNRCPEFEELTPGKTLIIGETEQAVTHIKGDFTALGSEKTSSCLQIALSNGKQLVHLQIDMACNVDWERVFKQFDNKIINMIILGGDPKEKYHIKVGGKHSVNWSRLEKDWESKPPISTCEEILAEPISERAFMHTIRTLRDYLKFNPGIWVNIPSQLVLYTNLFRYNESMSRIYIEQRMACDFPHQRRHTRKMFGEKKRRENILVLAGKVRIQNIASSCDGTIFDISGVDGLCRVEKKCADGNRVTMNARASTEKHFCYYSFGHVIRPYEVYNTVNPSPRLRITFHPDNIQEQYKKLSSAGFNPHAYYGEIAIRKGCVTPEQTRKFVELRTEVDRCVAFGEQYSTAAVDEEGFGNRLSFGR